ncbi:tetratricopeptide repeat protein [Oxalobacter sp. OttesenSCG-928-P03]|nr:tetratricopeptide repeat protein [Oxalobacter sp. OttesenSCG-928-P03]
MEQWDAALKDYDMAIALNPTDIKSYNNKGNILLKLKLKQYDDALESFNRIIELDPNDFLAYNNRSAVLVDMLTGNTNENTSEIKNHEFIVDPVRVFNLNKDNQFSGNNGSGHMPAHQKISSGNAIKLHLACGTAYKDGWINIDNNSYNNIQKLDLNWDLRMPLPFPDNSVDYVFNEHFLEHLTVEEGLSSLKDFLRVLKPGGVMRIAMPDLEEIVRAYLDENWKENYKAGFEKFGLTFIQTRAELININFRWWGHQWLYDWEELERRLKEAGGEKIKRGRIFESEHNELKNLETRDESHLIAEVTKL